VLLLLLLQGYSTPQTTVYYLLSYGSARSQLLPKYVAFARALNEDSSTPATLLRLAVISVTYSCVWWLAGGWIWRIAAAAGWVWRCVLWPVLLGQFWQPRWYITVGAVCCSWQI
jgi:hypothetical protein